jgi:hypothetical protein
MVNCGEVVVNCVVNVVRCTAVFSVEKHANFSKYIFGEFSFGAATRAGPILSSAL